MQPIMLASQSPRRAELLEQIQIPFFQRAVDIDETPHKDELALDYVLRMSTEKALMAFSQLENNIDKPMVLAADTIGLLDDEILLKPVDYHDAERMLLAMSGRSHQVLTAVCLCVNGLHKTLLSSSEVKFKPLSIKEIKDYWDSGEPQDKAGAYAIQGRAAIFIERLTGSYSGVMGLPLSETWQLIQWAQNIVHGDDIGSSAE